jgi:benzodiazapine receptor
VGLCLLVGAAASAITGTSVHTWYLSLARPPGTPPNWLFGPVWGLLYVLIGVAAWLVWRRTGAGRTVRIWGWQLMANALWTPAFFGLRSPVAGLLVMAVLLPLIVLTIRSFWRVNRTAAWILVPYLAWVGYAAYLNAGFWWLNQA